MKFIHPCTIIISGPSGSGKTVFTRKLIAENKFDTKFKQIIWCYSEVGSLGKRNPNFVYNEGLPSEDYYNGEPKLVVLDDLMHQTDDSVAKLFTKISHHRNVSVISIMQNIFPRNKYSRDISLNSNYLVIFRNPRDEAQVARLSSQICPGKSKFFMDAYNKATSELHGYLLVDFKGDAPHSRFMTNIFHRHPVVYIPR